MRCLLNCLFDNTNLLFHFPRLEGTQNYFQGTIQTKTIQICTLFYRIVFRMISAVYKCLHWITIYQDVGRRSFAHCLITYRSLLHNLANGLVSRRPGIILFNLEGGAWKIQVLIILEKASGCCFLTGGSFKTRFNFNVFEREVNF